MYPVPHRHPLGFILRRIKFHLYYLQLDKLLAKGEILSLAECRWIDISWNCAVLATYNRSDSYKASSMLMLGATTQNLVTCCLRFVHPWTSVFAVSPECSFTVKKEAALWTWQSSTESFRNIWNHLKGWRGRGTPIHLPARSPDPTFHFVLCGAIVRQNL
jgi:hypothetical protein